MNIEEMALQLPRAEKLRLMEALWVDLSEQDERLDSPLWHEAALRETEERRDDGKEAVVAWEDAKKQLRGQ